MIGLARRATAGSLDPRMRALAIGLWLMACRPPDRPPVSEPLVIKPLAYVTPQWIAGEHTSWEVFLEGVPLGHATLEIGSDRASAAFATGELAQLVASVRCQLTTIIGIDAANRSTASHLPSRSEETITINGQREHYAAAIDGSRFSVGTAVHQVPGGSSLHTPLTALAAIRAWSLAGPREPDFLWLWMRGALYRLDVFAPERDDVVGIAALRVTGVLRAPQLSNPITVEIWLADRDDRFPLRLAVTTSRYRVIASSVH